jgi:hypothetical protein
MDLRRGEMGTAINTKDHFTSLTSDEMHLPIIIASFVCVVWPRADQPQCWRGGRRMTNGLKRMITARIGWFHEVTNLEVISTPHLTAILQNGPAARLEQNLPGGSAILPWPSS